MYKAITGITIWILFLVGLLALVMAFVRIIGGVMGATAPDLETMTAYFGYGVGSLFLSAVAVAIRNKLEE